MSDSTTELRPRIFVSSVVRGFEAYREAARVGVEAGGGHPVMVNEDFPAVSDSSRNACLDGIDSSDAYLLIVGDKGGWVTPSGLTVTEEEYEYASCSGLPILAFLLQVDRDPKAKRLAAKVSDYTDGRFRKTVKGPGELEEAVEQAIRNIVNLMEVPLNDPSVVTRVLREKVPERNEAALRFVLQSERVGELVDLLKIETPEFENLVFRVGHDSEVGLFSYRFSKETKTGVDHLLLEQGGDGYSRRGPGSWVNVKIFSDGLLVIGQDVTGLRGRDDSGLFHTPMSIVGKDVRERLLSAFRFSAALLEALDPYQRHQRFSYGVSLDNLGYRRWSDEEPTGGFGSMGFGQEKTILAFDEPRAIPRQTLKDPVEEVDRVAVMFRRRLGSRR